MKPFLKWAGGKTQLLPILDEKIPKENKENTIYIEPFVGAGAFFLYLAHNYNFKKYIICDINHKLINVYNQIKNNLELLLSTMDEIAEIYNSYETMEEKEAFYYELRNEFNENVSEEREAALFIFINKSCFNGIYRENSSGGYNVPFGKRKNVNPYNREQIQDIANMLNLKDAKGNYKVEIYTGDFNSMINFLNSNESYFIYMDPPYRPVTLGGFSSYHSSPFNDEKQIELANFIKNNLTAPNIKWLLSNSDPHNLNKNDNFFDALYESFNIERINAKRNVNSNGNKRGNVTELIIYNNYSKININVKNKKNNLRTSNIDATSQIRISDNTNYYKNFNYFYNTFIPTLNNYDSFVDWNKSVVNLQEIEVVLNILNSLLGKLNIKNDFFILIKKYPEIVKAFPILIAVRDSSINVLDNSLKSEFFSFEEKEKFDIEEQKNYYNFFKKTGLEKLFTEGKVKNLIDYVFGIEVGMDTNARKNRTGVRMENLIEAEISQICLENKNLEYISQATKSKIKKQWSFDFEIEKVNKKFDFAIYKTVEKKLFIIEVNFYGSNGSKLKSTAGEYQSLQNHLKPQGIELIWITDGYGWHKSKNALEEAYLHNDYILNLSELKNGLLKKIIK